MEKLLRKRALAFDTAKAVYRFSKGPFDANISNEQFSVRLEKLEVAYKNMLDSEEALGVYADVEKQFDKFETLYYEARVSLKEHLKSNNTDAEGSDDLNYTLQEFVSQQKIFYSSVEGCKNDQVKIPKINIEPFSGISSQWPTFYDFFKTTIHDNIKITPIRKLQILHNLLTGDAKERIRNIPFSSQGYEEAWKSLVTRYEDKASISTELISMFINMKSVSQGLSFEIRKIGDTADQVLRGLKIMGQECENRDPWLIFLLLSKLDVNTKTEWAKQTVNSEFPTIYEFLEFLNNHCRSLERGAAISSSKTSRSSIKSFHTLPTHNQKVEICLHCSQSHFIGKCPTFRNLDSSSRRNIAAKLGCCFNCLRKGHYNTKCKFRPSCQICTGKHHTLLHSDNVPQSSQSSQSHVQLVNLPNNNDSIESTALISVNQSQSLLTKDAKVSLLPTAIAYVRTPSNKMLPVRILLDSGSQSSFITDSCVQRLGLKRNSSRMEIKGLGATQVAYTKGKVYFSLYERLEKGFVADVEAQIITKITSDIPSVPIKTLDWEKTMHLADPMFNQPGKIDILIGCELFFQVLCENRITRPGHLIAQLSKFGWLIVGNVSTNNLSTLGLHIITTLPEETEISKQLRNFWEIEEVPQAKSHTPEEVLCENFYTATTTRTTEGRFVVRLPFKPDVDKDLGDTFSIANKRFSRLEQKLSKNTVLNELYRKFMEEYQNLDHMRLVTMSSIINRDGYYLPHHSVLKETSSTTKLRVVFDGSAKGSNGTSLNDMLMVGPNLQDDILSILIRFRKHKVAISSDIAKMYRQIIVHEDDRKYQKILWRTYMNDPIQAFELKTVTYGTSSAPFLAIRSLKRIAEELEVSEPEIAQTISQDFYVDDLLSGANNAEEAIRLKEKVSNELEKFGFKLRKWKSNNAIFLQTIPDNELEIKNLDQDPTSKVLGLVWNAKIDCLLFTINPDLTKVLTKRQMLSSAARIFDPLGLLSPLTIQLKVILQKLWLTKLSWDEPVPQNIIKQWNSIFSSLNQVSSLEIPRCLSDQQCEGSYEMHGFCDASETAYGCAVYSKYTGTNGHITIRLIAAKSKVAPLKQVSLPRLELCAAVLLTRLFTYVLNSLKITTKKNQCWTDSKIVLHWLSDVPRRWKSFVANRTSQILETMPRENWSYIPTKLNPADPVSRGVNISVLKTLKSYWNGPDFLKEPVESWPLDNENYKSDTKTADLEERTLTKNICLNTQVEDDNIVGIIITKFSSVLRMKLILCYILRFITMSCSKRKQNVGWISTHELTVAESHLIRYVQNKHFAEDIKLLNKNKSLPVNHYLSNLAPFVDDSGILRVGGRLSNAPYPFEKIHPIILPKRSHFTSTLIRETHLKLLHVGLKSLYTTLRQRYWIINATIEIKSIINKCVGCARLRAETSKQLMGNLPTPRVAPGHVFVNVGTDYAGPISVKLNNRRNSPVAKGYICIFVCLAVKAVHLEIVSDMTATCFVAALKRFVSRRGKPSTIYCDNGTNFVRGNKDLKQLEKKFKQQFDNSLISDFSLQNSINFKFNPPAGSHFGGIFEAVVKSTKFHLKRVIGDQNLSFEESTTLLCQIECILNSRPLCAKPSDDTDAIEALTPAHFLIGHALTAIPEPEVTDISTNRLSRWENVQKRVQGFWKCWSKEYLHTLQQRYKWKSVKDNLKIGEIVLMKDENTPPTKWALAKITDTHPGQDGLVRVVTIITSNKTILKRPVAKLVRLPLD